MLTERKVQGMREILFKAKRTDNGEWAEGYLFDNGFSENKKMFIGGLIIEEYCGNADDEWNITGIDFCEVDPETVCQCTGLTDKNGKKIWENDIVKTSKFGRDDGNGHNFSGVDVFSVKWDNGGFALFSHWRRFNLREDKKEYKVVGNIFDNPELLEGSTEAGQQVNQDLLMPAT